ncbi:hypothetical protein ACFSCZ_19540 [Siminovitchia sediminis]|uniref:DUF1700 domain-containing protein n=1 Tax=Siminovitchia sediminis TaxID=1274353 RepID=A0ABW4KNP4_9BACI
MTKDQFVSSLSLALKRLPVEEREDIIRDIEEHFAFGLEEGKTEEQIAESLGSPQHMAKEILASYHLDQVETTATAGNVFRAVWAVVGLSFFNVVIVLGPFLAILGILASGWISGAAFTVTPLMFLLSIVVFPASFEWFDLFFTLLLSGLGLFIGIGMYYLTKVIFRGFVRYLKFNTRLVKGGLKHEPA